MIENKFENNITVINSYQNAIYSTCIATCSTQLISSSYKSSYTKACLVKGGSEEVKKWGNGNSSLRNLGID